MELCLSQEVDETRVPEVPGAPDQEDGAVVESPSERLHRCLRNCSALWTNLHNSFRSLHPFRAPVEEVDFVIRVEQETRTQSSISSGDVESSEVSALSNRTQKQLQYLDGLRMAGQHLISFVLVGPYLYRDSLSHILALPSVLQISQDLRP